MEKINEYKIVCSGSITVLADKISQLLSKGYQPYGYPFLFAGTICQALVKYSD